jgi:calcineurin-like phosphoesterase family protein
MSANLKKFRLVFGSILFFSVFSQTNLFSQSCPQGLDFSFNSSQHSVNWYQFPEFSLPFKVIYSGSQQVYDPNALLKRGFSHVSNVNSINFLNRENKAYIYYGVAGSNQPWATHKSPYGNDMNVYHNKWNNDLNWISTVAGGNLDFDIFCLDIENHYKSRDSIIALKQMNFVPENLKALSNDAFIVQYQKDTQELYAYAANYIKQRVNARIFTSYGDVPILNTFTSIQGASWNSWQTDANLLNFISYDYESKKAGGSFYNAMDALSPNAYFYYDYPHLFAGEYLSYLMFQIEANKAWSEKDQFVFVWNRYSWTPQFVGKNIKPWMAEAMAIFPFMSGAKGLYLWDDMSTQINHAGYEYFMKGLYRLSKFKHFFDGNYELIQSVSARDYNENKQPIWRGVYKDGRLLVTAHNPWATSENQEVTITINYGSLKQQIALKGYEIFMCDYPADYVTANEIQITDLQVYPNPTSGELYYSVKTKTPQDFTVSLVDLTGRVLLSKEVVNNGSTDYSGQMNINNIKISKAILNVKNNSFSESKTIAIQP